MKVKNTIQRTFFFLLLCFSFAISNGQNKETAIKKIYLQLAAGSGSQNGSCSELGIQSVLKNNWLITFSYYDVQTDIKNLPLDYDPGFTQFFDFVFSNGSPKRKSMVSYSFTGGKCFEAGRNVWFTTEAGFSITNGEKISFKSKPVVEDLFGRSANYATIRDNKTALGGVLKADVNWAFLPYIGLGAGVFTNLNSVQSITGFQLKIIVGLMNRKNKS